MSKPHSFFGLPRVSISRGFRKALSRLVGKERANSLAKYFDLLIPGQTAPFPRSEPEGLVSYQSDGGRLYFPCEMKANLHLASGYLTWMKEKYRQAGFVEVEPSDLVVDCGAFVGGFACAVAGTASMVYAFEPSSENCRALRKNINGRSNVRAMQLGLYCDTTMMTMNLSDSHVDNSFLRPDHYATDRSEEVECIRLDQWAMNNEIESIDFLKVEAEGVEIEVLQSIGDLPVRKIAVDCSAERDGASPKNEVARLLADRRYELSRRGKMIYARQGPQKIAEETP